VITMKKYLFTIGAMAAALTLAACGGDDSTGSAKAPASTATGHTTVVVKPVNGVGNVLADASGKALYTPDQEAAGQILCTGACASIWVPLTSGGSTPTGPSSAGTVGMVERPDGTSQVTLDGKPLYTFAEDSNGQVSGNGVNDSFGGQAFTWHVVLANGSSAPASSSPASTSSGSGYGMGY
jgi:predicted lipoprotein with Yx(FWY)xxD motif